MPTYNGHPSRNAWNVYIYVTSDPGTVQLARWLIDRGFTLDETARHLIGSLPARTPDGAPITYTNVRRAIWRGI